MLSDVFSDVLSCYSCSRRAQLVADGPVCGSCGNRVWTDDRGILHVHQLPCRGGRILVEEEKESEPGLVPGSRTQQLRILRRRLASPAADLRRRLGDGYWDWLSYFNPNRYGYALLGACGRNTKSLVLSSGWGELVRVISQLGGEAIGIEQEYDGLFYSAVIARDGRQRFIHSEDLLSLPFRDGSFDNVFWDSVADRPSYEPDVTREKRSDRADMVLREANRVLKPGGRLLLIARNSASLWGHRTPVPPFAAMETIAHGTLVSPNEGSDTSRRTDSSRTQLGHYLALRRAGFVGLEFSTLWPDPSRWTRLVLAGRSRIADPVHQRGSTRKQRIRQRVAQVLSRFGLSPFVAPGYCIVATKRIESGIARPRKRSPSALEAISARFGSGAKHVGHVCSQPNSKTLSLVLGKHFIKIPLTARIENSLSAASTALAAITAHSHSFAASFVIPGFERVNGTAISVAPYISHHLDYSWEGRVGRLAWALDRLSFDAHLTPLAETDLWERLTSDEVQAAFTALGAPELLRFLEQCIARKKVLSGVTHGDLNYANVIQDATSARMIIDWDDVELKSPKLLDVLRACYTLARVIHTSSAPERHGGDRDLDAWHMLIARDSRLPLLHYVDAARGELTWREAVGVALLDFVERRVSATHGSPARRISIEPLLSARLALAQTCFAADGAAHG